MTFSLGSVAILTVALSLTDLAAQDLSRTPNLSLPQTPKTDQLPTSKLTGPLDPPATIVKLERPTYARVRETIDDDGHTIFKAAVSELPWLDSIYAPVETSPAWQGGKPVDCDVEYFLVFNPASAAVKRPTASARLIQPATVFIPGAESTH